MFYVRKGMLEKSVHFFPQPFVHKMSWVKVVVNLGLKSLRFLCVTSVTHFLIKGENIMKYLLSRVHKLYALAGALERYVE